MANIITAIELAPLEHLMKIAMAAAVANRFWSRLICFSTGVESAIAIAGMSEDHRVKKCHDGRDE